MLVGTQEFRVGEGAAVAHHSTLLLPMLQSVPSTQYVTIAEERLTSLRAKQLELLGLLATTKGNAEYQVGGRGTRVRVNTALCGWRKRVVGWVEDTSASLLVQSAPSSTC